jgi:preprotein translocase subunit SecG
VQRVAVSEFLTSGSFSGFMMGDYLFSLVLTVHVLVGIGVIGLVLVQHGKGADMGAAFGSGASGSLFGSSGSANFLSRTTAVLATVFFITSLGLSFLASSKPSAPASVMEEAQTAPATSPAPAVPVESSPAQSIPK